MIVAFQPVQGTLGAGSGFIYVFSPSGFTPTPPAIGGFDQPLTLGYSRETFIASTPNLGGF